MGKDPAVLFYTSDFLTGTTFFSYEQKGQYITLLCQQHQLWEIPEEHMMKICGSLDSPIFSKFKKTKDNTYYNERMRSESVRRSNYCESRGRNKRKVVSNQKKNDKEKKIQYDEFVYLTDSEFNKLKKMLGKHCANEYIDKLNDGIGSKGYKYKSHYHTILTWWRKDGKAVNRKDIDERNKAEFDSKYSGCSDGKVANLVKGVAEKMK